MRFGNIMRLEVRENWKILTIFLVLSILFVGGFVQVFPSMSEAFEDEELEGSENIDLELIENNDIINAKLEWVKVEHAESYELLVSETPQMLIPERITGIQYNQYEYSLTREDGEIPEFYFAVVAIHEDGEREFVGIQAGFERMTAIEEVFGMDLTDIRGFISMMWDMWWILIITLFLGYISANSISKDFEENRMDIILSKPISRRQYFLEKFSILAIFMLAFLTVIGFTMIASVGSLGELNRVSSSALLLSTLLSWPVFLVIIAASLLGAVYFKDSRKSVGFSLLVILSQFGINIVGNMSEALEYLRPYTILSYWDHEEMLFSEAYSIGNFIFMLALTLIIIIIAVFSFERKDIPG